MSFPRKLLAPGEEVVSESGPHWARVVPRVGAALLVMAGCAAVVPLWPSAPLFVGWILLAIGLAAMGGAAARLVSWRATELTITTRRIVYRTGVLHRLGREIPLSRVQDVTYHQSLLERMLGAGSLTIESAGEAGQEPFPDIRRPASVQSLINQLVSGPYPSASAVVSGGLGAPATAPAGPAASVRTRFVPAAATGPERIVGSSTDPARTRATESVGTARSHNAVGGGGARSHTEELRELAELHRLGVLTDDEYERQCRRVLDRL